MAKNAVIAGTDTFSTWRTRFNEVLAFAPEVVESASAAPTSSNSDYEVGTLWIKLDTDNAYILVHTTYVASPYTPGGTSAVWTQIGSGNVTLTQDVTGSGTGSITTTIAANAVTYAKMQQSSVTGYAIIAKVTTGAGNYAELNATTNTVLGRAGADLVFAQVATAQIADDAITYAKMQNASVGFTILAKVDTAAGNFAELAVGTNTVVGRVGANIVAAQVVTGQVADNAITLAKMDQVITATFLGRTTAGTGNVEALTATQATAMLNTFSTVKGLVPGTTSNTTNFLRADGTFAVPVGTVYTHPNHSGDVTSVGDGSQTIAVNVVTNTKLADMAAYTIKLRNNVASGDPEDVKVSGLTEQTTPVATDWLLGETAGGALGKFSVKTLIGKYLAASTDATTSRTMALTDIGTLIQMTSGSANNSVIPTNAAIAFPINTRVDVMQYGTGKTTITGPGVTIRGQVGSRGQYTVMSLWKRGTDEWVVFGGGP